MTSHAAFALPARAIPIAPLTGPGDTLAYAAAARPRPFVLATAGCSLRGTETRGVDALELEGGLLLAGLTIAGASCGNVLLAPAQARRELVTPAGTLIESLLVARAGLVAQWTRAGGAHGELDLVLLLPGALARAEGPFLRVDGGDGVRLVQITPAPEWRLDPGAGLDGIVRVRARLPAGEPVVRLAATRGVDLAGAEAALRRLGHAREARAEGELVELRARRLAVRTGVDELDEGVAWAIARLEAALGAGAIVHELAAGEPFPFDPDGRRGWVALGALTAGTSAPVDVDPTTPLGALARAREATLRGRRPTAADAAALEGSSPPAPTDPDTRPAWAAALLAGADALEPWIGRPRADEMRARATALVSGPPRAEADARRTVRLPTLGGARIADPVATILAAALDLPGRAGPPPVDDDPPAGLQRALAAWAHLNDGRIERGFALFRAHLADGFAQGTGLWPDRGRVHDPAAAALVPLVLAHGLLGARADAHYGRLRLSPRLPSHWNRLTVSGIAIGDAIVRMEYERERSAHRFRFTQEGGRVPVMLIFEPLLELAPGARAEVDGQPAEVDVGAPRPETDGRAQLKIQLPLDRERAFSVG